MGVKLDLIRNLQGRRCEVVLVGDNGEARFDIKYGSVPPDLFVTLLEVVTLGSVFASLGEEVARLNEVEDSSKAASLARYEETLAAAKEKLKDLPQMLASIVTWQDVDDYPKPDLAWFSALELEHRIAYANAIIADKQRPTSESGNSSELGSEQKASTDSAPQATT